MYALAEIYSVSVNQYLEPSTPMYHFYMWLLMRIKSVSISMVLTVIIWWRTSRWLYTRNMAVSSSQINDFLLEWCSGDKEYKNIPCHTSWYLWTHAICNASTQNVCQPVRDHTEGGVLSDRWHGTCTHLASLREVAKHI